MKKLVKNMISKEKLSLLKLSLEIKIIKIMSKTKLLTSLYYTFSGDFKREQRSVLIGKLKHLYDIKNKTSNQFLLRRNIHRLEKGLLMKPMRKIFAINYLEETVTCYRALLNDYYTDHSISKSELKWAYDVLSEYFEVTDSHELINRMQNMFTKLKHITPEDNDLKYVPYTRNFKEKQSVSFENLLELTRFRRSVRWFKDEKISRNIIDNALSVATLSPSACNRQPFRFRFFDEDELLNEIVKLPMGTKGYSDNIPAMAAVIGDLSAYPFERDRHLIYIDSSLSVMSFILALETQGVGSCIINWPDIETKEKNISKLLNLDEHERVIMLIGIGYPDESGKVAYSQKKDIEQLRLYN